MSRRAYAVAVAVVATCVLLAGCGGDPGSGGASADGPSTPPGSEDLDRVVSIEGNRGLYIRCTGSGSPTVIMEGGDEDMSDSYATACPWHARLYRINSDRRSPSGALARLLLE